MVTLADVEAALGALSALAVILGVGFVIVQLRQNARLLEATWRQQRVDVSISLIERITDPSFPVRRARMHETMKRFTATGWAGALESPDDFEIRNYAYLYELIGVMAKQRLVDLDLLADVLQGLVVRDWQVFAPHAEWMRSQYKFQTAPYAHFGWLADETRQRITVAGYGAPVPPGADEPRREAAGR